MKNCTKMRISMITRGINQTYQLQKGGAGKKAQFPQPAVRLKSLTNDTLELKQKNNSRFNKRVYQTKTKIM